MRRMVLSARTGACVVAAAAMVAMWPSPPAVGQAPASTPGAVSQEILDDLVAGNRILAREGVVDGLGHISVRHPQRRDRFLVSRDLAPGLVTAADFVEYDLDGNPVDPNPPRGYSERFIHAAIYKVRSDVGSIVHAHTPSVVSFTVSNVPLRPVYHVAAFLLPGVPSFEIRQVSEHQGMLVNDVRSGTALAAALGGRAVVLMRGHGYVVVGSVIPEAVHRAIVMDVNARMQAQAMALGGTVRYLSDADMAGTVPPESEYMRGWPFYKERALRP